MSELHLVEIPPHPDLSPFVGVVYYANISISAMAPERKCVVLPHAGVDLVINLGGPFSVEMNGVSTPLGAAASLHGPQADTAHLRRQGSFCIIGVRLRHGVAAGFLNFPVKEICGKVIPAESFWPGVKEEMLEPVFEAGSIRQKMQVLEKALMKFFSRSRKTDQTLRKAVKLMAQHQGDVEVTELARQLKVSRQTVKHKFDAGVGLSPKQFGKLRRFQNVLRTLSLKPGMKWSELAHNCGYYDQAHLIREFNSFTGFSPEKFLKILKKGEDIYIFETTDLTHYHLADRFKALAGLS